MMSLSTYARSVSVSTCVTVNGLDADTQVFGIDVTMYQRSSTLVLSGKTFMEKAVRGDLILYFIMSAIDVFFKVFMTTTVVVSKMPT